MSANPGAAAATVTSSRISANLSAAGFVLRPGPTQPHGQLLENILASFAAQPIETMQCIVILDQHWYRAELHREGAGDGDAEVEILLTEIAPPNDITRAELDVITLLACGCSNIQAANRLHVAPRTVATHVEHILVKLGVENRTGIAVAAMQRGLLRMPLPGFANPKPGGAPGSIERALSVAPSNLGVGSPRGSTARSTVLLGSVFHVSAPDGLDMQRGANLAVEMINRAGGVGGRLIEHIIVDADTASESELTDAVSSLLAANVDAITFSYAEQREVVPHLLELVSGTDTPFFHAMTSDAAARLVAGSPRTLGNVYQLSPSSGYYGVEFLRFIKDHVPRRRSTGRAVVVTDDYEIPESFDEWQRLSRGIGYDLELRRCGPEDWQRTAFEVAAESPDAVMIASFLPRSTRAFLDAFLTNPSPTLVYGVWSPGTPEFAEDLSRYEGVVWATATGRYQDMLGGRFDATYRTRYGVGPASTSASVQYDAVQLMHRAWSHAPSPRSLTRVHEAMRTLVHRGVNGSYYLGDRSQAPRSFPADSMDLSIAQAHLVEQVQDGRNRIIAPAPFTEHPFRLPSWMSPAHLQT